MHSSMDFSTYETLGVFLVVEDRDMRAEEIGETLVEFLELDVSL